MHPYISFFKVDIPLYSICMGAGLVIGLLLMLKNTSAVFEKRDQDTMLVICGGSFAFAMVCAFLHNKITRFISWQDFFAKLLHDTGIAFLGGFIGGSIGFCLLFRIAFKKKYSLLRTLDLLAPSVIIGHMIGRIGCFFGGCCYGKPATMMGVRFAEGTPAFQQYSDALVIPTQLFEAAYLGLMYLLITRLKQQEFATYLILYSVGRFIIEFFRGDIRGNGILGLSPAQSICIFMLTAGVIILLHAVPNIALVQGMKKWKNLVE